MIFWPYLSLFPYCDPVKIRISMQQDKLSALQVAVTEGCTEVAELLIDRGADLSVLDKVVLAALSLCQ